MLPQPELSEIELIRRAQAGDTEAFGGLVWQLGGRLRRTATALCGDVHLAEDLVQETLAEAWRSLGRFDHRCRFTTWAHAILVHRSHKAMRWASSRPRLESAEGASIATEADQNSPLAALERQEAAGQLHDAVKSLPEDHRAVIELRFFADLPLEQIAAALDVPLGTVKSRLHHALEKLRSMKLFLNHFAPPRES